MVLSHIETGCATAPKNAGQVNAFHGRRAKLGPGHPHTIDSLGQLVRLYESWPKPEEAEKYRAKLASHEAVKEAAKTEATD